MQSEWLNSFRQNGFSEVNILRSSTVLEELMNSSVSNSPLQPLNEALKRVMDEHYRLIFPYGNCLGYRVFRASKKKSPALRSYASSSRITEYNNYEHNEKT